MPELGQMNEELIFLKIYFLYKNDIYIILLTII